MEVRPPLRARVVDIDVLEVFTFKPLSTAVPIENLLSCRDVLRSLESVCARVWTCYGEATDSVPGLAAAGVVLSDGDLSGNAAQAGHSGKHERVG